ncbi:hypothetical protein SprV_0802553400 [Sparganum proliferum]
MLGIRTALKPDLECSAAEHVYATILRIPDFLAVFDLLVDCRQSRLNDRTPDLTDRVISSSDASRQLSVLETELENPFRQLLAKYARTTRPNFRTAISPLSPVFSRPRPLAPPRLAAANAEFEHMLQMGIIRQSKSPWLSLLYMIPNAATGDWRPAVITGP